MVSLSPSARSSVILERPSPCGPEEIRSTRRESGHDSPTSRPDLIRSARASVRVSAPASVGRAPGPARWAPAQFFATRVSTSYVATISSF
jgi:hypothetical protein